MNAVEDVSKYFKYQRLIAVLASHEANCIDITTNCSDTAEKQATGFLSSAVVTYAVCNDRNHSTEIMLARFHDLKDSIVFITGGSSGIGAQLVKAFAHQGAQIAFVAIDKAESQLLCEHIFHKTQQKPNFIHCDIRDIDALKGAIGQVEKTIGPISVLINNAADDTRHSIESFRVEDWDNSINTNLRPHFFSIQAVLPGMKNAERGSIINVGSNSSLLGLPDYPSYVAAKAGIVGLTKAVAREIGKYNIRANALIPGWVMTERQKRRWATPEAIEECLKRQCLKRPVTEEDVANCALFLASDTSAMMTGQSLVIDGGRA